MRKPVCIPVSSRHTLKTEATTAGKTCPAAAKTSNSLGGAIPENLESSDDGDEHLCRPLPPRMPDTRADAFSPVQSLRYGTNSCFGTLELCDGEGGTSDLAFRQGLRSGGHLDKLTNVNLDDPCTQRVILHYLDDRYVRAVTIQPSRSICPRSCVKAAMNYTTWKRHHEEDLPALHSVE